VPQQPPARPLARRSPNGARSIALHTVEAGTPSFDSRRVWRPLSSRTRGHADQRGATVASSLPLHEKQ
jgi:hypothetical protein